MKKNGRVSKNIEDIRDKDSSESKKHKSTQTMIRNSKLRSKTAVANQKDEVTDGVNSIVNTLGRENIGRGLLNGKYNSQVTPGKFETTDNRKKK